MTRAEQARHAAALKGKGLNGLQIAKRMGISSSYAYELLNDPTGEQVRLRKRRYDLVCVSCGGRADGTTPGRMPDRANPVCGACASGYYATWNRDAVVLAIREWADDHGGVPPSSNEWMRACAGGVPGTCSIWTVFRHFALWNDAIVAAGFEPHHGGPLGGYTTLTPQQRRACAVRYAAGESTVDIAIDYGCSPGTVARWVHRYGVRMRRQVFPGRSAAA